MLLIDPDCVFRKPITQHVARGFPVAQKWVDVHMRKPAARTRSDCRGGFHLLKDYCVPR